ncbi:hypothetical protein FQA47_022413 [Oryzias melastigma]|uniref:Uncharacterized protein n=1 Tax=Oryzias melastigma TaxID=30732 RepID=A0A834L1U0_ORYME|nr:hypothetical protein FQA47_022413 [Oryzias melastigma]
MGLRVLSGLNRTAVCGCDATARGINLQACQAAKHGLESSTRASPAPETSPFVRRHTDAPTRFAERLRQKGSSERSSGDVARWRARVSAPEEEEEAERRTRREPSWSNK